MGNTPPKSPSAGPSPLSTIFAYVSISDFLFLLGSTRYLDVGQLGKSSKSTSLPFSVTQPSVTVKSSGSNAATPSGACFACSSPVGRHHCSCLVHVQLTLEYSKRCKFCIINGTWNVSINNTICFNLRIPFSISSTSCYCKFNITCCAFYCIYNLINWGSSIKLRTRDLFVVRFLHL